MSGETNLQLLLQNLTPTREAGEYVFCTGSISDPSVLKVVIGSFREAEGSTYILPRKQADLLGMSYGTVMAWISLQVHSSLQAIGLTAAVATALAEVGISCNVVAAFYHDHLFVPLQDAEKALQCLHGLSVDRTH